MRARKSSTGGKRPVRAKDLLPQLKRESNPLKRKMMLIGYVTDRLERRAESVVLVGGQAVETYTAGQFTTGDVDIVTSDRESAEQILAALGFERVGMIWLSEKLGIAVQIVGAFPRSRSMIRTIMVGPYNVRVVGVEDLIVDRLAAAKFWKRPSDIEQARVLFANFKKQLDMGYLKKRATEEHILDVLARVKRTSTLPGRENLDQYLSQPRTGRSDVQREWMNLKTIVHKKTEKQGPITEQDIKEAVVKRRHKTRGQPIRVKSRRTNWGREAFVKAGDATFGE